MLHLTKRDTMTTCFPYSSNTCFFGGTCMSANAAAGGAAREINASVPWTPLVSTTQYCACPPGYGPDNALFLQGKPPPAPRSLSVCDAGHAESRTRSD